MRELEPSGGARYVGFIKDLMDVLADKVGFQYNFKIPDDKQYGQQTPTGWTGMIGDVVNKVSCCSSWCRCRCCKCCW